MFQKIQFAQKHLKIAQFVGIGIYLLLMIAKKYLLHPYQFGLIALLAILNGIWVYVHLYTLYKYRKSISNYNKARMIMLVCGFYALILVVLSLLEAYIRA